MSDTGSCGDLLAQSMKPLYINEPDRAVYLSHVPVGPRTASSAQVVVEEHNRLMMGEGPERI